MTLTSDLYVFLRMYTLQYESKAKTMWHEFACAYHISELVNEFVQRWGT